MQTEGWSATTPHGTSLYHYILNGHGLCGMVKGYAGELLVFHPDEPRDREECRKCYRLANERWRKLAVEAATQIG